MNVPRTILNNGKRSYKFLQSRSSNQCPSTQHTTQSIRVPPQTIPTSQPPLMSSSATQPGSSNHATFPSRSTVSDLLISQDMSKLNDEISQLRSDISSLRNLSSANVTSDYRLEIGRELNTLRNDVTFLREKMSSLSAPSSQEPDPLPSYAVKQDPSITPDRIKLTAWNCRGLTNAYPYLNHLISDGSEIIILLEHWLWPFNLDQLQDIHPDYAGFGFADKCLNEKSQLTRGCGGVGIIGKSPFPSPL